LRSDRYRYDVFSIIFRTLMTRKISTGKPR
jgi:hypothetical protein